MTEENEEVYKYRSFEFETMQDAEAFMAAVKKRGQQAALVPLALVVVEDIDDQEVMRIALEHRLCSVTV
jgi:hypothetical protein